MNYPTSEEIREAYDAMDRDGPMAEVTIRLCALVLHDRILRGNVRRLLPALGRSSPELLLASAIATGLNYGMRIHEQRMAVKPGETAGTAS
jgi:hypothetical protein